jgi:type II secretory pathway pseudopilin PulG
MTWLLIAVLAIVTVLALLAVVVLAAYVGGNAESEQARIEVEVRRAERQLHDIARDGFAAMLDEARSKAVR